MKSRKKNDRVLHLKIEEKKKKNCEVKRCDNVRLNAKCEKVKLCERNAKNKVLDRVKARNGNH